MSKKKKNKGNFIVKQVSPKIHPIFKEHLLKCFKDNSFGIITFTSKCRAESWDVKVENNEIIIGIDMYQNILFQARLINLFSENTGCVLRIFTKQNNNNLPIKEIYGFALTRETIVPLPANEVAECFQINAETGEKIEVEDNVIFSDIEGNQVCWFDLK